MSKTYKHHLEVTFCGPAADRNVTRPILLRMVQVRHSFDLVVTTLQ